MIKAVIFDFFETLITHFKQPLYFSREIAEDVGIDYEKFRPLWEESEFGRATGKYTFEEIMAKILKANNVYSDDLLKHVVERRIAVKMGCFDSINDQLIPTMKAIKEKGLKIAIVSNCFSEEVKVVKESVFAEFADAVILSYETGYSKPDKRIFLAASTALGVNPDECLYVGDGRGDELNGSSSAGMKAMQAGWYIKISHPYQEERQEKFKWLDSPIEILENL